MESLTQDNRERALGRARQIAQMLRSKYHVSSVFLFGSFARGYFDQYSDLDIAIQGVNPALFFKAAGEATSIQNKYSVDLVDIDDCSVSMRKAILQEGIRL